MPFCSAATWCEAVPTVYIVDDDASVLDSMALVIRLLGWEVRTFPSGERLLREVSQEWDGCLLIDFNLGSMTAAEVIRRMRAAGIGVPAIVASSESRQALEPLLSGFAAVEIIEKPMKPGVLESSIRRALSR